MVLDDGSGLDITEAGTRKGSPSTSSATPTTCPGIASLGPDPLAEDFTIDVLERILHDAGRAQIKGVLRHQGTIAGIGNAYSDELLHAARMSPFKPASSLTEEDVQVLYDAIRTVLGDAVERSRGLAAADLKGEKKSHLAVHGRKGQACPVCGDTVREVSFADSALQYCADLPDRRQAAGRPPDVQAAEVGVARVNYGPIPTVTVADLPDPLPDGLVVLDVREEVEWRHGHIEGATHIPLRELPDRLAEVPHEQTLVVCKVGGRSAQAVAYLSAHRPRRGEPRRRDDRLARRRAADGQRQRPAPARWSDHRTALGRLPSGPVGPVAKRPCCNSHREHRRSPRSATMSRRKTATTVGILFFVQMVTAMVGTSLIQAFVDGDTDRTRLTVGVLLMMCSGIAVVGIGLLMYPVLKPVNARLARVVPGASSHRVHRLHRLRRLPAGAARRSCPNHLLWVYLPTGIGGLILTYLLFVSRLVPRPIAVLGLVGYACLTTGVALDLLGVLDMDEGAGLVLLVPGGLFEFVVLPIWLIAKGFSRRRSGEAGGQRYGERVGQQPQVGRPGHRRPRPARRGAGCATARRAAAGRRARRTAGRPGRPAPPSRRPGPGGTSTRRRTARRSRRRTARRPARRPARPRPSAPSPAGAAAV